MNNFISDIEIDMQVDCNTVGINGGCGYGCPVFTRGDCENIEDIEIKDMVKQLGLEDTEDIAEYYPELYSHLESYKNDQKMIKK